MKIIFLFFLLTSVPAYSLQFWDEYKVFDDYNKKDFTAAAIRQEKLLLENPKNTLYQMGMGDILYQKKKFADAEKYFTSIIQTKGLSVAKQEMVHFNLGSAQSQQEKWQVALESFEKVVELNKDNERARKNIEIIKKLLEKQQEQQKNDKQKNKDQKKEEKQSDKNQDQDKSKQDKDGQQDKSQQGDQEKSDDNNQHGESGKSDSDKNDSEKQVGKQKGEEDGAQDEGSTTGNHSQQERRDELENGKTDEHSDDSKENVGDGQNDTPSKTDVDNKDESQKTQHAVSDKELEKILGSKEYMQYLQAVQNNDSQANRYLMKQRSQKLAGKNKTDENNW